MFWTGRGPGWIGIPTEVGRMATPRKALSLFSEDSETASATVRPPLKWAGGKRWQVSELRCYWEQEGHRRLVEPFCGGSYLSTRT